MMKVANPLTDKEIEVLEERNDRREEGKHYNWETSSGAYHWRPGDPTL